MAGLIARYGPFDLVVLDVVSGVPVVYYDQRIQRALDVTIKGERLNGILHAPRYVAAPAGLWADFDRMKEGGGKSRASFPVVLIAIDASGTWADGLILTAEGIESAYGCDGRTFRFVGFRLGEAGPYCPHDEDK